MVQLQHEYIEGAKGFTGLKQTIEQVMKNEEDLRCRLESIQVCYEKQKAIVDKYYQFLVLNKKYRVS